LAPEGPDEKNVNVRRRGCGGRGDDDDENGDEDDDPDIIQARPILLLVDESSATNSTHVQVEFHLFTGAESRESPHKMVA
jgi:hypothetical protein